MKKLTLIALVILGVGCSTMKESINYKDSIGYDEVTYTKEHNTLLIRRNKIEKYKGLVNENDSLIDASGKKVKPMD